MKKSKSSRDKTKPLRPRCAYNFFFKHRYDNVIRDSSGGTKTNSRELTRVIGKQWKTLSPEERSVFEVQAKEDMRRYKLSKIKWEAQRELGLTASVSSATVKVTPMRSAASDTLQPIDQMDYASTSVDPSVAAMLGLTSAPFAASSTDSTGNRNPCLSSIGNLETEVASVEKQQRMVSDRCRLNILLQRFESAMQRADPRQLRDDVFSSFAAGMPLGDGVYDPEVDLDALTGNQTAMYGPTLEFLQKDDEAFV